MVGLQLSATTTIYKKVGDIFTISVSPVFGQNGVVWSYDSQFLEVVSSVAASAGTMDFKAKKATSTGTIIQATISYYANGSTGKSFQDWKVVINESSSNNGDQGNDNNGGNSSSKGETFTGVNTNPGNVNDYEIVDLGLSVNWATKNIGATTETDYGSVFAWGEINTKNIYSESNSKTYSLNVFNDSRFYKDGHYILPSSMDAATYYMGDNWRMPTLDEIRELINRCTYEKETQGNREGYRITGPSGRSIFFPSDYYPQMATCYWSSETGTDIEDALGLLVGNQGLLESMFGEISTFTDSRATGCFVRGVTTDMSSPILDKGEYYHEGLYTYQVIDPVKRTAALTDCKDEDSDNIKLFTDITIEGIPYSLVEIGRSLNAGIFAGAGWSVFAKCVSLKNLEIPEGVKIINDFAISDIPSLETISLPSSLLEIHAASFYKNPKLKSLYLPANVQLMYGFPCAYCESLENIEVDNNNPYYASEDGLLYNKDFTTLIGVPKGKEGHIIIKEGVQNISTAMFNNCPYITSVELPESLKELGNGQFAGSDKLVYVISKAVSPPIYIEDWETYIEPLTKIILYVPECSIDFYKGDETWSKFKEIRDIEELNIKEIERIELSHTEINLIEGETLKLEVTLFPENATDKTIVWSSSNPSVASINNYGLIMANTPGEAIITAKTSNGITAECQVTVIEADSSHVLIDGLYYLIDRDNHTAWVRPMVEEFEVMEDLIDNVNYISGDVVIPEKVKFMNEEYAVIGIDVAAFAFCSHLKSVSMGDNITIVASSAFLNCENLESVKLSNSLDTIYYYSFAECPKLDNITLGNNIQVIQEGAFAGCKGLTNINLSNNITSIGDWAFHQCGFSSLQLPDSLVSLGFAVFQECKNLSSLIIPSSVTSIGEQLCYECENLQSVEISSSLEKIPVLAFAECHSLTSVKMGDKVGSFGDGAFYRCFNLPSIQIPDTLEEIGEFCFTECYSLTSLSLGEGTKYLYYASFAYCTSLKDIEFRNIVTINDYAFQDCSALTQITLPESLVYIGEGAFFNCLGLKEITCLANIPPSTLSLYEDPVFNKEVCDSAVLNVPMDSYYDYMNEYPWSLFKNIVKIGYVDVESISLNPSEITLTEGDSHVVKATLSPENATEIELTWTSSNIDVATVENGEVKALHSGTTVISATAKNGISATCQVTVVPEVVKPESILLNYKELTLAPGEQVTIEATVYPENTTDKTVTWESSDLSVAIVVNGIVAALKDGMAIITASCGDVSTSCQITVETPAILPESITLNNSQLNLTVGETFQLVATVLPEDTTDKNVIWYSYDSTIADVSDSGFVKALAEGNTVIKATCGDLDALCVVMVSDNAGVEGILADPDQKIRVYTLQGILVYKDCKPNELKNLAPGIYIIHAKGGSYTIAIRN